MLWKCGGRGGVSLGTVFSSGLIHKTVFVAFTRIILKLMEEHVARLYVWGFGYKENTWWISAASSFKLRLTTAHYTVATSAESLLHFYLSSVNSQQCLFRFFIWGRQYKGIAVWDPIIFSDWSSPRPALKREKSFLESSTTGEICLHTDKKKKMKILSKSFCDRHGCKVDWILLLFF